MVSSERSATEEKNIEYKTGVGGRGKLGEEVSVEP